MGTFRVTHTQQLATSSENADDDFPQIKWEFQRLLVQAKRGLSNGNRPWMAVTAATLTIAVYALLNDSVVRPVLWRSGSVYSSLPFITELQRLPMSLFLPTPYLPEWGAVLQLLVVLGLGELIIGRWLTVSIALLGHGAATLTARVIIDGGHGSVIGLPHLMSRVLDTGPSAATVALGACLLIAIRANWCIAILSAALVFAAVVAPGIDGAEHLVALTCGSFAGVVYRLRTPIELRFVRHSTTQGSRMRSTFRISSTILRTLDRRRRDSIDSSTTLD